MKSSMRDGAEGKWHKVKGKIKEIAGKVSMNPELEAEGKKEGRAGEAQEKSRRSSREARRGQEVRRQIERSRPCCGP